MTETKRCPPSEAALAQRRELEAERRERMRRIRANERDHFERTRIAELIKPTRETEAKLRPDPVERLHSRGTITDEQRDAALEIRAVYSAICGALLSRSNWPDGRPHGRPGGMAEWLAVAYSDRYKPWADDLSKRPPMLEVAISVIVDGATCGEVDRAMRRRKGEAAEMLDEALGLYVKLQKHNR